MYQGYHGNSHGIIPGSLASGAASSIGDDRRRTHVQGVDPDSAGAHRPIIFFAVIAIWFFSAAVKVVQEYERGVVFRLGRLVGARGPGPDPADPQRRADGQGRPARHHHGRAVAGGDHPRQRHREGERRRLLPGGRAARPSSRWWTSPRDLADCQTTLRSVLGQSDLDKLLASRDEINAQLQRIIDEQTEAWGIKVTSVGVRDVELPETMQRAMARQAEAEREKRAKLIHAEGELAAAERLAAAAEIISSEPAGLQLRYLQTLTQIVSDRRPRSSSRCRSTSCAA